MTTLRTALGVEWSKFRHARFGQLTTLGIILVTAVISPLMNMGDASTLSAGDWARYFDLSAGTVATGGLFGFGLVAVWLFAREFADGTIAGLFGLPVRLSTVALAKLVMFALWATATTLVMTLALVLAGLPFGLGPCGAEATMALGRLVAVSLLTAWLTLPFALVASLSRDYLGPIGAILLAVIVSSVLADGGLGGWVPFAAPGYWAAAGGSADPLATILQVSGSLVLGLVCGALTLRAWRRLEI
ncbi:ABC transporter permease [Pseudoroseicyclus sp. H15]